MGEFVPRLTKPGAGNKYYIRQASGGYNPSIQGSPVDAQCDVLANCVGYAVGRFNEIGGWGSCAYLAPVNAENFMRHTAGLETGWEPELGACMVWQKGTTLSGDDGAGHVAIVERIISDTEIITSESGWGSSPAFWTRTRSKGSDGNWGQTGYKFLGFVYNPGVASGGVTPATEPTTEERVKDWQRWLGVPADGEVGPDTRAAAERRLLQALLTSHPLQEGARGDAVKVLQGLLYAGGYDPNGLDGEYGPGCAAAVRALQADSDDLDVDGVAGRDTIAALLGW